MNNLGPHPAQRRIKGQPRIHRPRNLRPAAPAEQTADIHDTEPDEPPATTGADTQVPKRPVLPEWHTMTAAERATAWSGLCQWVTFLYDRYELSADERLPKCWAEHPGLIEELWALKNWRHEIYTSTEPVGHAAQYWHNELRTLTTAATTMYAAGCRSGHKTATHKAADDEALQRRWHEANPMARIPPQIWSETALLDPDDVITGADMNHALEQSTATLLSASIPEFARYDSAWWLTDHQGHWIRIKDPGFTAELDSSRAAIEAAEAAKRRRSDLAAILDGDEHDPTGADHA